MSFQRLLAGTFFPALAGGVQHGLFFLVLILLLKPLIGVQLVQKIGFDIFKLAVINAGDITVLNFVVNGTEVLKVNGGSVSLPTGLTISGVRTPTSDSEAANKQYVDTQLSTKLTQEVADTRYLQLGGGTINGTLKFNNGMGEENYASIYSDKSAMFIDIPGGEVYIGSAGRSDDIVVTRGYIDDVLSGYLPLSGGTLTGDIHIKSNASDEESDYAWIYNEKGTLTLESASGYVDLHVKTPIYDDQPANKAYVDSHPVYHAGTSAPSNTNLLWIDTNATTGGLKYYNGSSWVHVPVAYS